MKLTIKTENGQKIVDLKNDLQFNTLKGEQYVFSNGFSNYVLNFKDNQESVVLTFNVDGKSIKVELNGIVPLLQSNTTNMSNPTAIIINKDVSNKDLDSIVENNSFNGGEIIDRLEALISKPVELGDNKVANLTLISDYQTLLESLGAAAAGGQAGGNAAGNGSTFNSIFSIIDGGLNGIADTARGVNLTESISTIPVDSADTIAVQTTVNSNVNVKLVGVNTVVTEGENAIFRVILTDDTGNAVLAAEDITVTFKYTYITANGEDITETISVVIPAGSSEAPVLVKTIDDNISEGNETFTIEIDTVSNQTQFDTVTVNKTPVETTITDETVPTTPDDQTALVSIEGPANVTEGSVTTDYTVTITQAPTSDLTVFFTYSGVAKDGTDFTGKASVVIKAGETTATFNIATTDDNLAEGSEKFTVSIDSSKLGTVGGLEDVRVNPVKASVETTITDETVPTTPDDQTALVSIEGPANVTEGSVTTDYTVTITQAPTSDLTVFFTYSGVAKDGTDFTGKASVVIKAGETTATFNIATTDDNLAEGSEKFTVSIDSSKLGTVGGLEDVRVNPVKASVETTITDETVPTTPDDQTALVSIEGPANVTEGSVTTDYTVTITQAPTSDLTVFFTYSGVAKDGTDFTGKASVVIKAGETTATFNIATTDDNLAEGSEKFTVSIDSSKLGTVGGLEDVRVNPVKASVETTITDETVPTTPDDQTALVSIEGPANVTEGSVTTDYTVTITQAPTSDLTVFFTYSGVAKDGTDFTGKASVVIKAGETTATFNIATTDDNLAEGSEKFTVSIDSSKLGTVGGLEDVRVNPVKASVETTITDETVPTTPDDQTALVSIEGPANVTEGSVTTDYTVTITQAPTSDLTVFFTYSGVAKDGTDFTGKASVVIKAGETTATFNIATTDDNLAEGSEKFTVSIDSSKLGTVGGLEDVRVNPVKASVETTITDETVPTTPDDQTALVSIEGPANVTEGSVTTDYTVTITQAPTSDLTVFFTYSGVAKDGTDFTGKASVVIKAGETTATFNIATTDDNLAEGSEKFTVSIDSSKLGTVGGLEDVRVNPVKASVETTITDETVPTTPDDQTALVSIEGPANVTEGSVTTDYTVTITQAPTSDLTVFFTYSGVAKDGTDFTGKASVVIKAGETTATFNIATTDDNLAEGSEKFTVSIDSSKLGTVGGLEDVRVNPVKASVETTITDETVPTTPDDQTALVSIEGPANVTEGSVTTDYTVTITQAPTSDLTVFFTYSGVAKDGTDFTGKASVVIKAGETTATFNIATTDDNLAEGSEKFTVSIDSSKLGTVGGLEDVRVNPVKASVETTITDETVPTTPDDQTALVSIEGPANVTEGSVTTDYTVTITQAPTSDLTVFFTYSGVAKDGTDFTGKASVVIKAGETTATFNIATTDDNLAEGSEKFTVSIDSSKLGTVGGLEDVRVNPVKASVETTITDETVPTTPDDQTALVSIEGPANVTEGSVTTDYTVTITQAPTSDLTVFFTYSGVAKDGTDFTGKASVVIKAGETTATFNIATTDDNLAEGSEKFTVSIDSSKLGTVGGLEDVRVNPVKASVETTITDETVPTTPDDQTALVSIEGPANVTEGSVTTDYTVTITQAPTSDLTVFFTYSGVAKDGTDFTGKASVVIKAGETTATFNIATTDDNLAEGSEKFTVSIDSSKLGTVGGLEDVRVNPVKASVETTITDETVPTTPDDQTALVSIEGPANVTEGSVTTDYTVTITQAPTSDLTVFFTYSGVAKDGTDFTGKASVVIKAGETTATFNIATTDDNLAEGSEKFTVSIDSSKLGTVGGLEDVRVNPVKASVETTITDETVPTTPDDQTALVSIEGPANVTEGSVTTDYTVTITQAPTSDLTVFFTYSGVAKDGTDFTGKASVVIKAGETTATFNIATTDDNLAEGSEKFTVSIDSSKLGTVGGLEDVRVNPVKASVETTITDETVPTTPDDQTALVSIEGPANVTEGSVTTDYTVTITQAPTSDLTVFFTYSGVAKDGTDFTGKASVVIKAGETTATFNIATTDDNLAEGSEKFTVSIDSSKLGTVGGLEDVRVNPVKASVETTITDETVPTTPDDQTALVSIEGPANVTEGSVTTDYTVTITQAPTSDLTVFFTYSGVAKDGTDFTGKASVVIKAGETTATFNIATTDDNLAEGSEKFTVSIDSSKLGTVGGLEDVRVNPVKASVETTITDETVPTTPDDQTALVSIEGPANVTEGSVTTDYTVTITQAPTSDLTVFFTYSGVAKDGTDFTGKASVVIKAGETTATFNIATTDDNLAEGSEKFTVSIDSSKLGTVGGLEDVRVNPVKASVETTITDETVPTTPDDQTALVSIEGPANVTEGSVTTDYTVTITQAPTSDLTVFFTYSGVAKDGTDFTGKASVVIKAGETTATFNIATTDDNLAEGSEKFTVSIDSSKLGTVGGLEDVRVNPVKASVETTITDETVPNEKDNINIKLVGVDTTVIEGESATYKVTLTDDLGKPVVAVEDMEVTFTYTYITAEGEDIIETASVTIKAGSSEAPVSVKTIDDNIYEISEEFSIAINTVSNQTQFENVTVDKTPVITVINDEDGTTPDDKDGDKPILIITGSTVSEKVNGVSTGDKVVGTVEISIENGKVFAEDLTITLSNGKEVIIKAGETTTGPIEIETNRVDDYYKQGTTTYDVSIQNVSNSKIDITNKTASIIINDDVDPVDVTISATVTTPKIIDVTTATDGTTGVKITGFNSDGTQVNLSIITNSDHNGFGIDGKNLSNGDSKELGVGEKIVVEFTDGKDVNSLDVSFAWRNNHETAKLTFIKDGQIVGYAKVTGDGSSTTKAIVTYYDENNNLIKTVNAKGSSDKVDEAFTFELPDANGGIVSFDKVEFSAPTNVDDYLINKIVYKEVINTEVTNVLTDDAKVTFNIQLDENYPPQGTATAKLEVNGVIYDNVIINATGRATLTVDGKDLGDLSKVVIKVLEISDKDGNEIYEKVNLVEKTFDFTPVLKSSDDSITTNEDETYTLKVTDFGEVSVNTTMFKITELPINGKLFLTITMGDTIFNPDGTQTVATQNTKVEITKDQIISLAQIGAKKVEFVPNEDSDIDGSFKFEVGDGTGKFSGEYTTAIEVVAVADAPTASINVTKIDDISSGNNNSATKIGASDSINNIGTSADDIIEVNKELVMNDKIDLASGNDILILNKDINQVTLNLGSGNDEVIINGKVNGANNIDLESGDDVIRINDIVTNNTHILGGDGKDTLYLRGNQSDYTFNWQTNNNGMIEGSITDKIGNGTIQYNQMETIVFGDGSYIGEEPKQVAQIETIYQVDLSAALADLDGSETLTVKISGVPTGATFDLSNMTNLGGGVWEVIVPKDNTSIDYKNIKMIVPSEIEYVDLKITATATENSNKSFVDAVDTDATIYGVTETEQVSMKEFKYNLLLTIDNSGSMKEDKIALAKAAMVNLINKYDDLGEVKVLLNVFNNYGEIKAVWVNPSEASIIIDSISANGGTNYDDALLKNISALTNNPAPLDGKTISYFVSDGVPTYGMYKNKYGEWKQDGDGKTTTDVNDTIVKQWKELDINKTYTVGIGTSELNTYLREISQTPDEDVIIIKDANTLSSILENTVQELLIDGNVTNNVVGGDGDITIDNIEINGNKYTKDNFPEDGLLLGNNKIKFTFDFETGDYKYYAKSSNFVEQTETFKVNASDSDGDKTSFDVSSNIKVTQSETGNVQNLMGEDIDLTTVITKNTDVINLENTTKDKITIELDDLLVQEDKQLIVKGDKGDIVQLDTPSDWSNGGSTNVDGVNYKVYTGTGVNSTIKLLIEDDIDITPDI